MTRVYCLALATVILAGIVLADWFQFGLHPLREGLPDLSQRGLLRAAAYLSAALCFGRALFLSAAQPTTWAPHSWTAWLVPAIAGSAPLLMWFAPAEFIEFAVEDGPVESATVLFYFLAALLGAKAALARPDATRRLSVAAFSLSAFLIAGEEISWGQRIFGFGTPEAFSRNIQNEMNLHNFHTDAVEAAFYFLAGFVFFCGMPFFEQTRIWNWPIAEAFRPRACLIPAGAAISAMNYDMWNSAPTQFAFWGSLVTVGLLPARTAAAVLIVLCATAQFAILDLGALQARIWDITEYKELALSAGFLLHALDLNRRPAQ